MRKLLILGAGIYQVPLIKKAREMGLYTIAASCPGPYPGLALADETWEADTTDYQKLTALAREKGIDGVCTTGTDVAVISLGAICGELGLTGVPLSCARLVTDKALMKEAFEKSGVSTPKAIRVTSLQEASEACIRLSYPVIIKATDSSGSRGVTRADTAEELKDAYEAARQVTKKDHVLAEKFMESDGEIGVDGFISGGRIRFLLPHGKFTHTANGVTLPEGHRFPLLCAPSLMEDIRTQTERAVAAVGMDNCAFNADVLISGDKAWILEIGARAGATCIPELLSLYCGFDYYRQMICHALGEEPDFTFHAPRPCMAKLLFSPCDGVITAIDEAALAELRPKCADLSLDYRVGDQVERVQNGTSRMGQVILETTDEGELNHMLARIRRAVKINGTDLESLWNG